ncbi:MAG: DnaB-like helicase N-terminal domain-containing protein [Desulfosarcina sp.]|jgi:replicative DNA helicase
MKTTNVIKLYEEISVFNEILTDNSRIGHKIGFFFVDTFSIRRHRLLRRAIATLYGLNSPVDLATLTAFFSERGLLEAVGGWRYLKYISQYNQKNSEWQKGPFNDIQSQYVK